VTANDLPSGADLAPASLFWTAVQTEAVKFRRAPVPRSAAAMLVVGIAGICLAMILAAEHGDPQAAAKLGPVVAIGGWTALLSASAQISAVGGLIGFGVVLAWTFGREFNDGTISGLFALPVTRGQLAGAKFAVFGLWSLAVSAGVVLALLSCGLGLGLGLPQTAVIGLLGRQFAVCVLTAALTSVAALAASLGRSMLAGIATVIGVVVLAQVVAIAGAGGWFPFTTVALWATTVGPDLFAMVSPLQLGVVVPTAVMLVWLTIGTWRRLELDR
jgi:ABC-2 type transport system permease protein